MTPRQARPYAEHHGDLRAYLETSCTPIATEDAYLIVGTCAPAGAG